MWSGRKRSRSRRGESGRSQYHHKPPKLYKYGCADATPQSNQVVTLTELQLPQPSSIRAQLRPFVPMLSSGEIICGYVFIKGVRGKHDADMITITNSAVAKMQSPKSSWSKVFIRVDPTIAMLACYMAETSKRAIEMIDLNEATIKLIGKNSKNPKGFISWQVTDKWNQSYSLATPDIKITQTWTEAMRYMILKVCERDRKKFFHQRQVKREKKEQIFNELKKPPPDQESIRLQNLIAAATEGDLDAVREFLKSPASSSENKTYTKYKKPPTLSPAQPVIDKVEIWEEATGTIENIKVNDQHNVKDILHSYGYAVGQDVLRGQLIGVKLTSLKCRSAQIIQSYARGMITRARYTKKFSKGPKSRFIRRKLKEKNINKIKQYYKENPLRLHEMRLRKRKKKELESPYDKFSDHLQRLMAFAPHRTENMVRFIQKTFRGYTRRKEFREAILQVRRNAAAIQGWYRTTVNLYWRLRHNRARTIEKYERRRQARAKLLILRKDALEFISDIIYNTLLINTMKLVRAHIAIRWLKMKIFRMRFKKLKHAAITIASWWRGIVCKIQYQYIRYRIIRVQALFRSVKPYRVFQIKWKRYRKAALAIQGWWRAGTLPYVFQRKRRCVTYISAWYRCYHQRKIYCKLLKTICKLQSFYRRNISLGEFKRRKNAVTIIAAAARRRQARKNFKKQKASTLMLQMRIRIMLAKKALSIQQHYWRMLILVQKNARRYLIRRDYTKKYAAVKCLQQWWRSLVFLADANSHMAKIRTAAIIIQKNARRYLTIRHKFSWINQQHKKIMLWPNNGTIYQSNLKCDDGRLVLINISSQVTGLDIKAVDLSEGHKKSWDSEFNFSWHNLLLLIFLDPRLNCRALSPEDFAVKLAYILCHPVPSTRTSAHSLAVQSNQPTMDNQNRYLCRYSNLTYPIRLPKLFQKYITNLYDGHLSCFFIKNVDQNKNKDEKQTETVECNPVRNDLKYFYNTISQIKTNYNSVKQNFFTKLYGNVSKKGAYNLQCFRRLLSIFLSSKGMEKVHIYMSLLKYEIQKSTIFRTEIMSQVVHEPDNLCASDSISSDSFFSRLKTHNYSAEISTKLLQNMTSQIMLPMLQTYLKKHTLNLREESTGRIHFHTQAYKFVQWTLLLQFIRFCISTLSNHNNDEDASGKLAYWFQTFRGSLNGTNEMPIMLPQIEITSLVYGSFISSCDKKHSITSLLPTLFESVDILRNEWYQGFQRSTECYDEFITKCTREVFDENEEGLGYTILKAFKHHMHGRCQVHVSLNNNFSVSESNANFPSLCSNFSTTSIKTFTDCKHHLDMLQPILTKCMQKLWKESLKFGEDNKFFDLRHEDMYDEKIDLRNLSKTWENTSLLLKSLRKMNIIKHASDIQKKICHEVITQVNKQKFEQEKNVKLWTMKEEASQPNVDFEVERLMKKKEFIVGEESRPDKVDLATFEYHEAMIEVKKKEVELCKKQLETVRGACLDMDSDVVYARKEMVAIQKIMEAQNEFEHIVQIFMQNIDRRMSECNSKTTDATIYQNRIKNAVLQLEKKLFAYGLTRQLKQCDVVSRKISELQWELRLIENNSHSSVRTTVNYLIQTTAMIYNFGNAYIKWSMKELEGYKTRKQKMEKAIVVMNSTNDRLNKAEILMRNEINKCEKLVLSYKIETAKAMQFSSNYWWFMYSTNEKQLKTWHLERKKQKYREHVRYMEIKEEARRALEDDDDVSSTSSSSHTKSEGSMLEDESDAFETASDDESGDDGTDSVDSYDLTFNDLEDLSYEMIFMPLKKRREILLAKRMGEKKTKVKKAVKIWSDVRRKTIRRKIRQRSVQNAWEQIHFDFESLQKLTSKLAEDIEALAPRFSISFEGVAIQSVLKNVNTLVAHADWQDIHEISEKCENVISKLNQAYNMLDPLFHYQDDDGDKNEKEITGINTKQLVEKIDNNDTEIMETSLEDNNTQNLNLCPKTDLTLALLGEIVDVQYMIKSCKKTIDYIAKQHDTNTILTPKQFQMDGINHRKFTRADFMLYKNAFMKCAELKIIKGKPRYFLSAQPLARACEMCGRISIDWGLIPLQLERLYGKSEIEFDDFLDYVTQPLESELNIRAKYYQHVAKEVKKEVVERFGKPIQARVKNILDRWSPSRRKAIEVQNAVLTLQSWFRMATLRRKFRRNLLPLKQTLLVSAAALKIQGAFWRRVGRQFILQRYIINNYDKVRDPETEHIIYIQKVTKHSLMYLPKYTLSEFVDRMPFSNNTRYKDQRVLNAIRPEVLNEDRKIIIKLKKQYRAMYIKGIAKAKKTAERFMAHSGVYQLPCELIEVPRGLDILVDSLNDRKKLEELVAAFGLTSNGLKKAYAEWLKVKPIDYDLKDGIVL